MVDEYRIALTYSNYPNLQPLSSVQSTIAGVIAFEDDYRELERRKLPKKRSLIRRKHSLFLLQRVFDDIAQYLTGYLALRLEKNSAPIQLEDRYIKILNILRSSHLRVISGHISSIDIRPIELYNKESKQWTRISFSDDFVNKVKQFSSSWRILDWRSKDDDMRLMEVAKILARLEYERLSYFGPESLTSRIRASPSDYFQIIRTKWDSPHVDDYDGGIVGLPTLVIREHRSPFIRHIALGRQTNLSFLPLGKFCKGSQLRQEYSPCKYSESGNPFGLPLAGSSNEECHKCRNLFEYSICLYRKPLCNGYEVRCGNSEFAGNVCCGLFALYVTRFGSDLKVGTAMLTRVIGRLLEQGAGSALVVYPLEGIMTAHVLEKAVKDSLGQEMRDLNSYGIRSAFRRAPPRQLMVKDFLHDWTRVDEELLRRVWRTIVKIHVTVDGLQMNMAQAEHKICKFARNYEKPPARFFTSFLRTDTKRITDIVDGWIVGHRGSFLFLDSGKVVDLRELQGHVVKGSVFDEPRKLS